MLCGPVTVKDKDTSHDQSLWSRSASNNETMYNAWGSHGEQRDESSWVEVKQRLSPSPYEDQARIPTATNVTDRDRFNGNDSTYSLNGGFTTETGAKETERPQFHITIDKPIRRITHSCNVSLPLCPNPRGMYSNERRASDGLLSSPSVRFSGRNAEMFSTLSEEFSASESLVGVKEANSYNSGVSSLNGRRFSDGCFRNVPNHNGYRKVSVVLPQPRKSVNEKSYSAKDFSNDVSDLAYVDGSKNEEDYHWKELVAKAQGFKSAKALASNTAGGIDVDINGNLIKSTEVEDVCSDISSEASFSSNSSCHSLSENDSTEYNALTDKPISGELANYKCEGHTIVTSNTARTNRRVSVQPSFSSNMRETHPRRYSLETSSPARSCVDPKKTAKLSGYSTQSALEQARQLLGKLQSEGKNKNKKERLEELSTALKWILEELNRIETPDRELVSLFISLRAKIVNLKANLKAEEFDATSVDPAEEIEGAPRMQHLTIDDGVTNARSRRFSWC